MSWYSPTTERTEGANVLLQTTGDYKPSILQFNYALKVPSPQAFLQQPVYNSQSERGHLPHTKCLLALLPHQCFLHFVVGTQQVCWPFLYLVYPLHLHYSGIHGWPPTEETIGTDSVNQCPKYCSNFAMAQMVPEPAEVLELNPHLEYLSLPLDNSLSRVFLAQEKLQTFNSHVHTLQSRSQSTVHFTWGFWS